jgi:NAD+ kinase
MRGENRLGGMFTPKLGLLVSSTPQAEEAAQALRAMQEFVPILESDAVVVLGGDGFMLSVLHRVLNSRTPKPVFGMNRGTVGFLMNDYRPDALQDRVRDATSFFLSPLTMEATTNSGKTIVSPAINEVSLLRETRQAAKIEIAIDGKVRLEELSCDGALVSTPAGSTAYNLSAGGPILPLDADLLALTALSPFRPRRWKGALVKNSSTIEFRILESERRPVSAVADQVEVRDVAHVRIKSDLTRRLELLFDPDYALDDRILMEQFIS